MLASASCIIEKALLYARLLKYEKDFHLPDSKHMLHGKTGDRDTNPTAETKSEWLAAGFDQLDDICIQTDCTHGEDDEELAQCLERRKYGCGNTERGCDCCDDGSQHKVENKHRENLFKLDFFALGTGFSRTDKGEYQCDRNDCKGTGQLYGNSFIQCLCAELIEGIPGGCGSGHGRSIVDGSSGK